MTSTQRLEYMRIKYPILEQKRFYRTLSDSECMIIDDEEAARKEMSEAADEDDPIFDENDLDGEEKSAIV